MVLAIDLLLNFFIINFFNFLIFKSSFYKRNILKHSKRFLHFSSHKKFSLRKVILNIFDISKNNIICAKAVKVLQYLMEKEKHPRSFGKSERPDGRLRHLNRKMSVVSLEHLHRCSVCDYRQLNLL
jgi:hypothetical protein